MLTQEFFSSLENWYRQGRRSVSIEMESKVQGKGGLKIWLYDYDLGAGKFVEPNEGLPGRDELIRLKRQRLEMELSNL